MKNDTTSPVLRCNARQWGNAIKRHWGVHWVLDMAFREDESRMGKGSAPGNIAAMNAEYLENVVFQ